MRHLLVAALLLLPTLATAARRTPSPEQEVRTAIRRAPVPTVFKARALRALDRLLSLDVSDPNRHRARRRIVRGADHHTGQPLVLANGTLAGKPRGGSVAFTGLGSLKVAPARVRGLSWNVSKETGGNETTVRHQITPIGGGRYVEVLSVRSWLGDESDTTSRFFLIDRKGKRLVETTEAWATRQALAYAGHGG